mmetsp:Transcript_89698/g.159380  ORF Transcript_89698/g.159380 Transcript_89698/m.159380 type:complete len:576 (-) Transcript_89698:268-1995(-)
MGTTCSTDDKAPSLVDEDHVKAVLDDSAALSLQATKQVPSEHQVPEITRVTPLAKSRARPAEEVSPQKESESKDVVKDKDEGLLWKLPPAGRLTVLMFGMTGAGKSSLGNCIAGFNAFEVSDSLASVTNLDSVMRYTDENSSLILLDTIGLGDTELDQEQVVASIRDMAISATDGIDVLFFVMKNTRLADDAIARLIYVIEYLWTDECLLNLYVVVTCAPRYLAVPADGLAWIEKQLSNWRFAYIYKLVGENPNRFIFVDNPDSESGEPNCAERQLASRNALMKALVTHPRDIIPPWTSERMRDAQGRTKVQREALQQRAEEVLQAETALEKSTMKQRSSKSKLPPQPASESPPASADEDFKEQSALKLLEEKRSKLKQAEVELSKALSSVAADTSFKEMAVKEGQNATARFAQQYRAADPDKLDASSKPAGAVQAAKRLMNSLLPRGMVKKATKPVEKQVEGSPRASPKGKAVKVRVSKEQLEKLLDELVVRMVAEMKASPEDIFKKMDDLGSGRVTPLAFQRFLQETLPGINRIQAGALWRRVDTNCDGHLSLQEFSDLCKGRRGADAWPSKS